MSNPFIAEGGLQNGEIDPRAFPFLDEFAIETTTANAEMISLPANNIQNDKFIDFTLPIQNNVFYDLANSFFQWDYHVQISKGGTNYDYQNSYYTWETNQDLPFPAPFHSVLRFADMDIFFGNQRVSDKCYNNMFAFKEFAKHCLSTPGNQINLVGQWDSPTENTYGCGIQSEEVANTGITSFEGGATTLGFGAWEKYIFEYLSIRNSRLRVVLKPQDGFWRALKFVPASVPITIRFYNRTDPGASGNADYWAMSEGSTLSWDSGLGMLETLIDQRLWLKQIFPTNHALNLYKSLFDKNKVLMYNVQHAETVSFQISYGTSTETAHGLFTSRKPQTIFVHVIPTSNLQTATRRANIHPFANLSNVPYSVVGRNYPFGANPYPRTQRNLMKSVIVKYAGKKYPRTWDYQRDISGVNGLQSNLQDYREYLKQTKLYNSNNPNDKIPLLTDEVYSSNQIFVLCFTLQDSGESFQGRQYSESSRGSLSITVNFIDNTTENMTVVVTAFTNEIITVDENNIVAKSF